MSASDVGRIVSQRELGPKIRAPWKMFMRGLKESSLPAPYPPELMTHPSFEQREEDIERWIEEHFPEGVPRALTEGLPLRNGVPALGGSSTRPSLGEAR